MIGGKCSRKVLVLHYATLGVAPTFPQQQQVPLVAEHFRLLRSSMAKTKKQLHAESPSKKKAKRTADDEATDSDVVEVEEDFTFCLPEDENSYSTITRDSFRSTTCQGRFIQCKEKKEQTASMLLARVHNGHLRSKPGFKKAFKAAFMKWSAKPSTSKKKTRCQVLVNEYSRFFSTVVTAIKKEWYLHPTTLEDPTQSESMVERFVVMTRVTYCKHTQDLLMKPGSFKRHSEKVAISNFKAAYQVRICFLI
jgi:hypothetical protein